MFKRYLFTILAILGISLNTAHAVVLAPGSTEILPGTTSAAEPNLAGLVVEDDLVGFSYSSGGGFVSGSVQVRVVQAIDNTYDFYWRVINDANSSDSIGSFRIGEFYTNTYNANYRIDGLGDDAPDNAHRFDGGFDSYVNFNFDSGLAPGDSSNFFFLDTDATDYAMTGIYDLANLGHTQISGTFNMYAPSYDVPEAASLMLLGLGLLGLGFARRRV